MAEALEEPPRVKFLCSFNGSIMPRPQDGKLRYVGGETRIVSLPRDINFDELMNRMRELFEGASVLKYQQPDEDLDALVSVVNDDDVTNMMEEYDKLGSGDGFTRLRMFLFPQQNDQEFSTSSQFDNGSERESERRFGETERRYVDALNSLNDGVSNADFIRKQQSSTNNNVDSPVNESLLNPINVEFGLHNRNCEIPLTQFNLHHLKIPHLGTGQQQHQPHTQRYNEMEAPWSPAYYSPSHHAPHDPRPVEYPSSPSSARYRVGYGELADSHQQPQFDHQTPFNDNLVWLPPGGIPSEKMGFPGNLGHHGQNVYEGNNICEHCFASFQRNQGPSDCPPRYHDPRWKNGVPQQSHLEAQNVGNEFHYVNSDGNLEQNDPRSLYNEAHNHERGWVHHHQINHHVEDPRAHISGTNGVNFPLAHGNCIHHAPPTYIGHEDPRYMRSGPELGNEVFHDQAMGTGAHMHGYGNFPTGYGTDNPYQVSHAPSPAPAIWIKVQNPLHATPSYEALNMLPQANGTVTSGLLLREGSPSFHVGVDNQNPWAGGSSQQVFGFDGSGVPECSHGCGPKLNSNTFGPANQHPFVPEPVRSPSDLLDFSMPVEPVPQVSLSSSVIESKVDGEKCEDVADNEVEKKIMEASFDANVLKLNDDGGITTKLVETDLSATFEDEGLSVKRLSFLPDLIASVKRAALEGVEDVKSKVEGNADGECVQELDTANTHTDVEVDSDNDYPVSSKIEPTKAEAEALSRGLQTIKNDDLEEIRELGTGTYGAVYYGKWKGSDVAIKRIKASCFAGRPSERERLIADFWKEALILSSLHHPNVVSFYGIVRDGPDGSLATVTEFMVNGSLKQFLQKKDRTIDRRKRLIIAMDSAFGMEYLHGKNIVHFDLKCENLLVNMRDPHRPICKIGDLGLSKVKQHTLVSGGVRGTLPWMAPELLSGKSNMVTEKIDVYSFGIVMWELLTGEEPYAEKHCASIIGGIVNNTLRPQVPTWCDPEWKSLMESCWASEPGERPSFTEISQKLRKMAAATNMK
ncbi:hypothetical protein GIB67_022570 [Kingdonia uniflora]|uniref:Protein kinase domain-containing protein n=1 Tax=Kingdonia uniflora TaxID=39325 RepID=A0A7J7L7C0_9MAGN|nr:hypothetical protein GIB67_022570 [Kingdonia uniflora]